MKNGSGVVMYVGKALNLKKRVVSYFSNNKDVKTRVLVRHIDAIEYITTRNEYEALLLENTLIKKWQPRYNINLKDGKSYPVIRITNEEYPRVFRTRRIIKDGSEYYGPYPSVSTVDVFLEVIEKLYPLRKCRGSLKNRDYPCLYYHIHRCTAPCAGKTTREEYNKNVDAIRRMLTGSIDELVDDLQRRMQEAVDDLRFERAAEYRDSIAALGRIAEQQDVVDFDSDVLALVAAVERDAMCNFAVFQMRTGRLIGRDVFQTENYSTLSDALDQFILQYYSEKMIVPDKLFVPSFADISLLQRYFANERKAQTVVSVPETSRHISIMELARENALEDLLRRQNSDRLSGGLEELKLALRMPGVPARIEGFDISQLSGKHSVASMVSFYDGAPDKKHYRRFHIKTLDGRIDDFAAIKEVIARRYTRVKNESLDRPDLILVDGGKGQVSAARSILEALDLTHIPLAGLAKREEEIFLPGAEEPVRLPEGSDALRILQHVRDESHRFATGFNKRLRQKDVKLSVLEEVAGIGPKRAARILRSFGSLDAIVAAKPADIAEAVGIPRDAAEAVSRHVREVAT